MDQWFSQLSPSRPAKIQLHIAFRTEKKEIHKTPGFSLDEL
jgi:hypothetical protein